MPNHTLRGRSRPTSPPLKAWTSGKRFISPPCTPDRMHAIMANEISHCGGPGCGPLEWRWRVLDAAPAAQEWPHV